MKALLRKDFYMSIKYARIWGFSILIFLFVSVWGDQTSLFALYAIFMAGMLPYTLMAYEENCKWHIYCKIFPYSPVQIVSEKYLLTLLSIGSVGLLWVFLHFVHTLGSPESSPFTQFTDLLPLLAFGLIGPSMILPVLFKFGVTRGRMMYYLFIALIFAVSLILFSHEPHFLLNSFLFVWGLLFLFIFSWFLSIHFYKNTSYEHF